MNVSLPDKLIEVFDTFAVTDGFVLFNILIVLLFLTVLVYKKSFSCICFNE